MDFFITILETVSSGITPWILFSLFLAATAYFSFKYWRYFSNSSHESTQMSGSKNQNSNNRSSTNTTTNWDTKRNYTDTLKSSPNRGGPFHGWFTDEETLCTEFRALRIAAVNQRANMLNSYPTKAEKYLSIVNEVNRKPAAWYVWGAVAVMMVIEAFGFGLIFADKINDTSTANTIQTYAVAISCLLAGAFLAFAHKIGHSCYSQNYSHTAHQLSGNLGFKSDLEKSLKRDENEADTHEQHANRIANRSAFVRKCAINANDKNAKTPKYPFALIFYMVFVFMFGAVIAGIRLDSIDTYYKNQASTAAKINQEAGKPLSKNTPSNFPKEVISAKDDHTNLLTQETIESEKKGKQTATFIFVLIFFVVQTLAVLVSYSNGFASDDGEDAYKEIKAFRKLYGDIDKEKWISLVEEKIQSADSKAQETLTNWQLGLQTAFNQKSMKVVDHEFFQQSVNNFSSRTYSLYCLIKQKIEASETNRAERITRIIDTASTIDQTIASAPPSAVNISSPVSVSLSASSAASSPISGATDLYDYFIQSASGDETIYKASLEELKSKIMIGEVPPAQLNLRLSGQPGRFKPWVELAKNNFEA